MSNKPMYDKLPPHHAKDVQDVNKQVKVLFVVLKVTGQFVPSV